ncbi:outer membrane protein assembly factor BamE domain-containing protein [Hymenobacter wooponensis]|uniref:Outer membrane protein assembly factor BamE n=1 Tax=Hymenobacter wooponensis TaxID=1525360 RepID=A0A4Z0MV55_9BACT|nr:outer membrane protein assembly factor BamE [Hymenobacter wooponensis]TGD83127.1 outer membrane protein assembly factor BamE [Hymenobacter wooponensis]
MLLAMLWQTVLFYTVLLLCVGLLGLLVFRAATYLVARFWPSMQRPTRIALPAAILITPLLCVAIPNLFLALYLYYPHRDFNKADWATNLPKRHELVDDLVASHKLVGLTEQQVVELLGAPNTESKCDATWEYYLGMTPKLIPIDGDALSLQFSNGKVVRYWIHEM